ncbi:unnamed protein product [Clonostachys rhizophaga]|uniref:BTB domain-containing protein n=1 Tax=Clonostachys rhizophaga TaxID=160324 RepID=A0A9N9VBB5_9HYPO|nr:unnamed protein product [Clonostachys rhizophaga]
MEDDPSHTENNRITLRVGERLFHTTKGTLTGESGYFQARLTRLNDSDANGSYFIDSDPTLFEVILRYLRTGTPPLFFDSATMAHDLEKYAALLSEARYFQIPSLVAWIVEQRYLQVIQVDTKIRVFKEEPGTDLLASSSTSTSKVEYFPSTGIERRPYFKVLAIAQTVTFDPKKLEYYG